MWREEERRDERGHHLGFEDTCFGIKFTKSGNCDSFHTKRWSSNIRTPTHIVT